MSARFVVSRCMNWLLLRGLGREQRHWGDFPDSLRERLGGEITCIDLPGSGTEYRRKAPITVADTVDDLRQRWLAERGQDQATGILGLSLGGMLALDWVARFPEDFRLGVVISGSAAGISSRTQRLLPNALLQLLGAGLSEDPLARELKILGFSSRLHAQDSQLAATWADYARSAPVSSRNVLRQMLAAARFTPPGPIAAPLLILGSLTDAMVSPACSPALAQHYDAILQMHPNAGHDIPLDDPGWVIEQIQRFLEARHPN